MYSTEYSVQGTHSCQEMAYSVLRTEYAVLQPILHYELLLSALQLSHHPLNRRVNPSFLFRISEVIRKWHPLIGIL